MPTYQPNDLNTKVRMMGAYGDAAVFYGRVLPSAAIITADIIRWCRVPAGIEVNALLMSWASQGGTAPCDIGFAPVDTNEGPLVAVANYFRAALAMATASADGTLFMGFEPIKFEQDVFITGTFGTVVTGAAAVSRMSVIGNSRGVR